MTADALLKKKRLHADSETLDLIRTQGMNEMAACEDCGKNAGFLQTVCNGCIEERHRIRQEKGKVTLQDKKDQEEALESAAKAVVITTAPSIEGTRVVKTVDVVTAECVFGMNVFRDLFAGISDIFGGRSKASQKVLRDARVTCLNELRREAAMLGANAVIAVDLDYSEFSGGGKSMLFLVASGTAVIVEPE